MSAGVRAVAQCTYQAAAVINDAAGYGFGLRKEAIVEVDFVGLSRFGDPDTPLSSRATPRYRSADAARPFTRSNPKLENPTQNGATVARKEHCLRRPKNSQTKPPAAAQQPQPKAIDASAPAPRHAMALPIQARRRRPPSRLALLFAVCKCSDALTLSRRPLRQTRRTQLKMMDEVEQGGRATMETKKRRRCKRRRRP